MNGWNCVCVCVCVISIVKTLRKKSLLDFELFRTGCIWFELVWSDLMISSDFNWFGMFRFELVWFELVWSVLNSFDLVWIILNWFDVYWTGLNWSDLVWSGLFQTRPLKTRRGWPSRLGRNRAGLRRWWPRRRWRRSRGNPLIMPVRRHARTYTCIQSHSHACKHVHTHLNFSCRYIIAYFRCYIVLNLATEPSIARPSDGSTQLKCRECTDVSMLLLPAILYLRA